jgi:hypothetical protein
MELEQAKKQMVNQLGILNYERAIQAIKSKLTEIQKEFKVSSIIAYKALAGKIEFAQSCLLLELAFWYE